MKTRPLLGAWLTAIVLVTASPGVDRAAADPATGAKVFETLRGLGALDDYLGALVGETAADLARAANRWPGVQVNGPHQPGAVNVYVVDSGRLPERPVLPGGPLNQGRGIGRYELEGSALTDEPTGIVFVDSGMVKELVAATELKTQVNDIMVALALLKTRGLEPYRALWDPARNGALRPADRGNRLQMLVRGALGFVIAHEMGHLALGRAAAVAGARPAQPLSGKDRDVAQACPALIDPAHVAKQQAERAADDFAVGLLERLCGSWAPHQPRHLIYELGARWYFLYSISRTMLAMGNVTQSRNIHLMLRTKLGPELHQAVLALGESSDRGSVHLTYPTNHPPDYERAERLEARLSQSQCSLSRGESGSMEARLLEVFRQQACRDLAGKAPPR